MGDGRARFGVGLLVAGALALGAGRAAAQVPAAERLRLIQDRARVELRDRYLKLPAPTGTQTDVGAWITLTGLDLRDDDHQSNVPDLIQHVLVQDYRVWISQVYSKDLKMYGRARKLAFGFGTLPGTPEPDTAIQEKVEVDLLFLDIDMGRGFAGRPGRQFQRVGRGLTLSADLDGLEFSHTGEGWRHRAFGGSSLRRDPNLDTSVVGFDRGTAKRDFALVESEYRTVNGPRYYGYGVLQHDRSRSLNPVQAARPFRYHSEYLGVGAEGRVSQSLHYYLEGVRQTGDTLADIASSPRVKIRAGGALAGLLYYPRGDWHPLATLEYGWGSGDARRGSVTSVFGGKQTGTTDENFLYFGAFDGGLALSPRLSNLHVVRLGYQVKPRPTGARILPEVLVGGKVSAYFKDDPDGVISDPLPALASSRVGTGVDLFVAARPVSDFSLLAQVGRFMPGAAYPATVQDASNRILLTTTLSF